MTCRSETFRAPLAHWRTHAHLLPIQATYLTPDYPTPQFIACRIIRERNASANCTGAFSERGTRVDAARRSGSRVFRFGCKQQGAGGVDHGFGRLSLSGDERCVRPFFLRPCWLQPKRKTPPLSRRTASRPRINPALIRDDPRNPRFMAGVRSLGSEVAARLPLLYRSRNVTP